MKIVVVGGSGVIGSRLCSSLCGMGHEVFDASRDDLAVGGGTRHV